MAQGQITVVVGHEPRSYKRYGKRASVRTYRRVFMVSDVSTLEEYHHSNAQEACREWLRDRIARIRENNEEGVRYLHVTDSINKTKHQWTPVRGWVNKTEEK